MKSPLPRYGDVLMVNLGACVLRYLCFLIKVGQSSQRAVDKLKASVDIDLKDKLEQMQMRKATCRIPCQWGRLLYRSVVLRPIRHRAAIQQSVNGERGGVGVPHCGY